jgi:mono/diheme cytochrome c family protein
MQRFSLRLWGAWLLVGSLPAFAATPKEAETDPSSKRGYELLLSRNYTTPTMDQEVFDNLWKSWEQPDRTQAEKADAATRRAMTLARYGLQDAPGREGGPPLQFGVQNGQWSDNCFLCHGGKVAGKVIPGLPNTHIALMTMAHDTHRTKQLLGRTMSRTEAGTVVVPLGGSRGTTNAIIFGVLLAAFRDLDLNYVTNKPVPQMVHNDHDAPPWWHYKRKNFLYADGFAGKGHRALMQFMMTPENSAQFFYDTEADFKHVEAFINSVEPPKYPFPVDAPLAKRGEALFKQNCAECHGTYGPEGNWPAKVIPIDEIGTDRARFDSLTPTMRTWHQQSWFGEYGKKPVVADPVGYVAQPLDGIWATAPYLHNGSVPTLWDLFHPDDRPTVWRRNEDGYDQTKVGIEVKAFQEVPDSAKRSSQRREYFDSRLFGKGNAGHTFPNVLNEDEKKAVIEYLKTL